MPNIDHDALFKELLTTFFADFIQLFFPKLHQSIDWSTLVFLDKELFGEPESGQRLRVDLVARVSRKPTTTRSKRESLCLLIHLEHQAQPQSHFAPRMFYYFCHLSRSYREPIFPIALFSYAKPRRPEPNRYKIEILGRKILDFRYHSIQLNRLNWRDFMRTPNPIASALMAKMQIDIADRPLVKLQCLRLLATLKLDAVKQHLIFGFVEVYLKLNQAENQRFQQELTQVNPQEEKAVLELTNQFIEEGKEIGLRLGREQGIESGLRRAAISIAQAKFGADAQPVIELLNVSSSESSLMRFIDSATRGSSLDDLLSLLREV